MKRVLPFVLLLSCAAPALGQTVDSQGAKQLSDNLARYFGKQPFDIGFVKVSVEGDSYKLSFDFKPVADMLAKQQSFKFDLTPYFMLVKPRKDGQWDVSADVSPKGSVDFVSPEGPQHIGFSISNNKFTGTYDPDLAAFASVSGLTSGMRINSNSALQSAEVTVDTGSGSMTATKSANGGVDFTYSQTMTAFAESVRLDDPKSGLKVSYKVKSPQASVQASGKGLQTKPLLDLLAFAVANENETTLKANQAQLKSLLRAALPIWGRIDGTYGFKELTVESPIGNFGAAQFSTAFGTDGVVQNGKLTYGIKASGLTVPQQLLPSWSAALLPTDIDLNFGGANIDLDSMAKKTIEAFDLHQDPPLSPDFGDQLKADFMAKTPKVVLGHSIVKNKDMEIALEGEMTSFGEKPDANLTVDVAGYDKIVAALQTAAKTEPEAAQYFPFALAIKGFAKTLPDGRMEWVIKVKADGSVAVNGAMLKPADPPVDDSVNDDNSGGDDSGDDNGGAGAKLSP